MTWRDIAFQHARQALPHEACGLLVSVDGIEQYWPCNNIASNQDEFIIDPCDWALAEDQGDVTAVIHSHTKPPLAPSAVDIESCKRSSLPWYIVDAMTGDWCECCP
jgi:proteasome lid subunit RPN8/RPN11